jgi:hypothetical protein
MNTLYILEHGICGDDRAVCACARYFAASPTIISDNICVHM